MIILVIYDQFWIIFKEKKNQIINIVKSKFVEIINSINILFLMQRKYYKNVVQGWYITTF
jgi:hypothetical protein